MTQTRRFMTLLRTYPGGPCTLMFRRSFLSFQGRQEIGLASAAVPSDFSRRGAGRGHRLIQVGVADDWAAHGRARRGFLRIHRRATRRAGQQLQCRPSPRLPRRRLRPRRRGDRPRSHLHLDGQRDQPRRRHPPLRRHRRGRRALALGRLSRSGDDRADQGDRHDGLRRPPRRDHGDRRSSPREQRPRS